MTAVYQATVPWCSIIWESFWCSWGCSHECIKSSYHYAWPSGDWGSLPMEGGIEAAFKSDLEKSENPETFERDRG